METPYRELSFANDDPITVDNMHQSQSNLQWIYDNTPRGEFMRDSFNDKATNLVIVSGKVKFSRSKKDARATKKVRFGKSFAPACKPNVTTGVMSDGEYKIHCVVNGPGGVLLPDNSGFDITIAVTESVEKNWKISKPFYICWQAFGYREDNINDF